MGRSKPRPCIPYHVQKLLSYNRPSDRYVQESQKTTHDTEKRVSRITRSTVASRPSIKSFKDDTWVEPPVVKSHMDIENIPTVNQQIWADKVRAGNVPVSESTLFKMSKLFPGIFRVK
ncbi:hypothetical protein OCU04_008585 [Sclerotinia nivalis]|uniref:Uncharacterized protein n=1 Tax=Sclerotinia nivalis TaxID=352851 RepID=A0A9X0AIC9_9HELO|nr:hypothetical protein OCU04_008585 [Sclerotinia nivalis]